MVTVSLSTKFSLLYVIISHPTNEHAIMLNGSVPDKYPDANHKPEITKH